MEVYTDGACLGNPGPGGWAWAEVGGRFAAGPAERTTNQRMEIQAALEAVLAHRDDPGPLEVVSDSTYVVNCFRDGWWERWLAKGWVNSQRKPVANRDLWEPLIDAVQAHGSVTFRWVKGHSGNAMNDLVDRLAVQAAERQAPRTGGSPPEDPGRADAPAGGASTADPMGAAPSTSASPPTPDPAVPEARGPDAVVPVDARDPWQAGAELLGGHAVVVLGHRPSQLGVSTAADEDHPLLEALRDHLGDLLADLAAERADLVVVSGLRQGAESLGAEAALGAGLPLVAVLPYPDPVATWAPAARLRFEHLLAEADRRVVLQQEVPPSNVDKGEALGRRDAWLARFCDGAVVVWDGRDVALGRLVRSLVDHLGEEAVVVVDPAELVVAER